MSKADYTLEPGPTLNVLHCEDIDSGYIEDAMVEFVQSKGLGDDLSDFLRVRFDAGTTET